MADKVRTWTEGDTRVFAGSKNKMLVRAGLFWYHGFGSGEWFSADGTVHWGTTSQLQEIAKAKGEQFEFVDAFTGYKPTYLGD